MWGPRSIAKLVHITPISLWFMVFICIYNYSYWGESKQTYILGASHCMYVLLEMTIFQVKCTDSHDMLWLDSLFFTQFKLHPYVRCILLDVIPEFHILWGGWSPACFGEHQLLAQIRSLRPQRRYHCWLIVGCITWPKRVLVNIIVNCINI